MNTVAPATRLGLVLSIAMFTAMAAVASVAGSDALAPVFSLPWVLLVIAAVYLPRLVKPGRGWARTPSRRGPATVLFFLAAAVAVTSTLFAASGDTLAAILMTGCTAVVAIVAGILPQVTEPSKGREG